MSSLSSEDETPTRTEAWQCDGTSNDDLVRKLKQAGAFSSQRIAQALSVIDRGDFVRFRDFAYVDAPQRMGEGWSISAPHLHANALQVLSSRLCYGCRCLDIGCGSGYITAAMAFMVSGTPEKQTEKSQGVGFVLGIDIVPSAVESASKIIESKYPHLKGVIEFEVADGWRGAPERGPFDIIHCGAAVEGSTIPQTLLSQLASGGRMLICVGGLLLKVDKYVDEQSGSVKTKAEVIYEGAGFTPLQKEAE